MIKLDITLVDKILTVFKKTEKLQWNLNFNNKQIISAETDLISNKYKFNIKIKYENWIVVKRPIYTLFLEIRKPTHFEESTPDVQKEFLNKHHNNLPSYLTEIITYEIELVKFSDHKSIFYNIGKRILNKAEKEREVFDARIKLAQEEANIKEIKESLIEMEKSL